MTPGLVGTAPCDPAKSGTTHKYLIPREVAEFLRISLAGAYRLADDPSFPVTRVGRSWRIRADALDRWLLARTQRSRAR